MTTEKDRIHTCIEKYGLSEEEATRIVKENDMLLTVEELRMKFDNPNLGKEYPEWLTPEDHYKICCATVRQMYNSNFARICTPEEMASILFIKSSIKLHLLKSHSHLKAGVVTIAMNICRDGMRREKYWSSKSLDSTISEDIDCDNYSRVVAKDDEREASDCLNAVLSIKNREVREILILTGYIVGGIDAFEQDFKRIVMNSDLVIRDELVKLLEEVYQNDDIDRLKLDGIKSDVKRTRVTLKSVLKVFKTDLDLKSARQEIGEYLMSTGFMTPRNI